MNKKTNLINDILRLKEEKNAVIMSHFYQVKEIQDIADVIGDSLLLAQKAAETSADIILLSGVLFMGETAKILAPDKKVLIPDINAGCSLADSCPPDEFEKFIKKYPNHIVITYVNTKVEIKALSDIVVTSTNAVAIINSLPKDQAIIFGPDRNLGNYLQSITGREMIIWDGACHVHEQFSVERIVKIKKKYPKALLLAHPECKQTILLMADFIGSTSALFNFTKNNESKEFIIATEAGILHLMKKASPEKLFIPAPPIDSTCGCSNCEFMKMNTLKKIYNALKYELPVIEVEESLRKRAVKPIEKMLELSEQFSL